MDYNMVLNIMYDHNLDVTDYNNLRDSAGWGRIPERPNEKHGAGMTQWIYKEG